MSDKKCPNCGRCEECGHVPQPPQIVPMPYPYPVAPYRPPWPNTWQPQPWISRPYISCGTSNQLTGMTPQQTTSASLNVGRTIH